MTLPFNNLSFLHRGGEVGKLLRETNWNSSPLGSPESWPDSLRYSVQLILSNPLPMSIVWGDAKSYIYNDACLAYGHASYSLGLPIEDTLLWSRLEGAINAVMDDKPRMATPALLFENGESAINLQPSMGPLYGDQGEVSGVLLVWNSLSSPDQDRELYKFKFIADQASDPFILMRKDGSFAYLNKIAMEKWGYSEQEVASLKVPMVDPIYNIHKFEEAFALAQKQELPLFETLHRKKDGTVYPVEIKMGGLVLEGEPYMFAVARDITGRKIAEDLLKESERKFRSTVKQAPIGITILRGEDFVVEMANDAYLQIIDHKECSFVGRPIFDSLPEVRDTVESLLSQVYRTGKPYAASEFPIPLNRKGKPLMGYFNFLYHPLLDEDGQISGIIATASEVTESVKTKQFIAESEKKFRELVMDSPIPMTIVRGEEFRIEIANRAMFEKIWRLSEAEVLGKNLLEVFPELHEQKYPEILETVYQSGTGHREIESLAYVAGSDGMKKFYLDYEYLPLKTANGKISGIMITVNDVTERVEARKRIEESEQRFRHVADSAPALIWMTDVNALSTFFNTAWLNFTGRTLEEEIGKGWLSSVHPDDRVICLQTYTQAFENREPFYMEYRLLRYDGQYHWISDNGVPRFTVDGGFQGYIGACMNIQEQKAFSSELEKQVADRTRELEQKNRELESKNVELQSFAYISSHDLQEPLRKIQAFTSQLRERELDLLTPAGRNAFFRIENAAHRMQALIQDLLTYSRTNSEERNFKDISLTALIEEVQEELKEEIQLKAATIRVSGHEVFPVIVFQFKQLIHNLISNALKFSREEQAPDISIQLRQTTAEELLPAQLDRNLRYVYLSIQDNGIGFEPEYAQRIFEVFQRLHPTSRYMGTGIGLAIVKKIVDNHDGFILAKSALGQGATFEIYLPILKRG
ncbi:PAS domain-containing sensor histidine kinase [Dyadobacter tibetensis]|uniref:PAS domain-containing sensor histidine kinase n=1 Tax=Dyadobacter tibetensis TaxID=1211851 RepID=UPI0004717CC8|nr:PAS domain S-box protein [Dyadobacter tibetensis]